MLITSPTRVTCTRNNVAVQQSGRGEYFIPHAQTFNSATASQQKFDYVTATNMPAMQVLSDSHLVTQSAPAAGYLIFLYNSQYYRWKGDSYELIAPWTNLSSFNEMTDSAGNPIWIIIRGTYDAPGITIERCANPAAAIGDMVWTDVTTSGIGLDAAYPPPASECAWSSGQRMMFGEYNSTTQTTPHVKFFWTEDGGLTWSNNYTFTSSISSVVRHTHHIVADPDDSNAWYLACGDGADGAPFIYLVYSGGNWTATQLACWYGIHGLLFLANGDLLIAGEAACYVGRYNLTDQSVQSLWTCNPLKSSANYKFLPGIDTSSGGIAPRMLWQDPDTGLIYAPTDRYLSNVQNGLYVSADNGATWTAVWRDLLNVSGGGLRMIWKFKGVLYIQCQNNTTLYCAPPKAASIKALKIDSSLGNAITVTQNSAFTTSGGASSVGNWAVFDATLGPNNFQAKAGGLNGKYCLSFTTHDTSGDYRNIIYSPTIAQMAPSLTINANTYFVYYFYMRAIPVGTLNFPAGIYGVAIDQFSSYATYIAGEGYLSTEWIRIGVAGKFTGTSAQNIAAKARIRIDAHASDNSQNLKFEVQISNAVLHTSADPMWIEDAWNNVPNVTGTAESSRINLGLDSNSALSWTVFFDWMGGASDNLQPPLTYGAIASIVDSTESYYVEIQEIAGTYLIRVADSSTNTASSEKAYYRFRDDVEKFCIVNDENSLKLVIKSPDNDNYETVDLGHTFPYGAIPHTIRFGESMSSVSPRYGRYFNVQVYNKAMSDAEIENILYLPGVGFSSGGLEDFNLYNLISR